MFIWFLHITLGPRNCGITPLRANRHKSFEHWLLSQDTLVSPLKVVHGPLDTLASPVEYMGDHRGFDLVMMTCHYRQSDS
jgi:hypothetical protein